MGHVCFTSPPWHIVPNAPTHGHLLWDQAPLPAAAATHALIALRPLGTSHGALIPERRPLAQRNDGASCRHGCCGVGVDVDHLYVVFSGLRLSRDPAAVFSCNPPTTSLPTPRACPHLSPAPPARTARPHPSKRHPNAARSTSPRILPRAPGPILLFILPDPHARLSWSCFSPGGPPAACGDAYPRVARDASTTMKPATTLPDESGDVPTDPPTTTTFAPIPTTTVSLPRCFSIHA